MQFPSLSSSAGLYLLNVAVASVVLSLAAVATGLIVRRRELPLRHGLLSVALSLVLLSPLAIWIATVQGFGIIPISLGAAAVAEAVPTVEPPVAFEPQPLVKSDESDAGTFPEQAETAVQNTASPISGPVADLKPAEQENTTPQFSSVGTIGVSLVLLWATVALWYMARLVRGMFIMGRLGRSLQLTTDDRIKTAMQVLSAAETNPATPVYESSLAPAPLTFGCWRPVIVMPIGLAKSLSNEELASVLAHEAAHARRHDTVIALLQQLARIGFWWNPLLHSVSRQISQLREKICDDHVVKQFGDGLPLAQAILKVAKWSDTRDIGLPMVTALLDDGDEIEQRITRLTERKRTMSVHLSKKSVAALGVFAVALTAMLLVPVVRARMVTSKSTEKVGPISTNQQTAIKPTIPRKPAAEKKSVPREKKTTASIHVWGRALNQAGVPVVGAKIYLVSTNAIDKRLGETTTYADGTYEFRNVSLPLSEPKHGRVGGTLQVYGEARGLGLAWHGMRHYVPKPRPQNQSKLREDHRFYQDDEIEMNLEFRAAAKLAGRVTDEKGKPAANVQIRLLSLDYLDTEGQTWHPNFREFWGLHFAPPRYREARTGSDGRFEINGLPANTAAYVSIEHSDYANETFFAAITDRKITEYRFISNTSSSHSVAIDKPIHAPIWKTRTVRTSPLDVRVLSTRRVVVKVVREDDKRPAKNIRITATSGNFQVGILGTGKTDEHGQAELSLPPGKYRLVADPPRETDCVRTYDELAVQADLEEQAHELQLKAGCILVLEAVDAATGLGIPDVEFLSEEDDDRATMVQSSTTYADNPRTNAKGELRAVVMPGKRHYRVVIPDGYRADRKSARQLVDCTAGKTVRVRFALYK